MIQIFLNAQRILMGDSTENLDKAQKNQKQESSFNFSDLKGKPFWIWDKRGHLRLAQETNELYHYLNCRITSQRYEKILFDTLMNSNGDFKTNISG